MTKGSPAKKAQCEEVWAKPAKNTTKPPNKTNKQPQTTKHRGDKKCSLGTKLVPDGKK